MFVSTETRAPCSKVSAFQTGQPQRSTQAGSLMPTLDKLGKMLWTICTQNGHPFNSLVNVLNQTFFNGSVWSHGDRVCHPDSSTTKFPPQPDGDTVATCWTTPMMTRNVIVFCGHLIMLIKKEKLFSVWTQPHPKEELLLRKSTKSLPNWPQRLSKRTI